MDVEPRDLTLGQYLEYVLPELRRDQAYVPLWPPDVFGICASLLVKSGTYGRVLESWPPSEYLASHLDAGSWPKRAREVGRDWREAWSMAPPGKPTIDAVPGPVLEAWTELIRHRSVALHELSVQDEPWSDVMRLLAFADEACSPVGITLGEADVSVKNFVFRANALLSEIGFGTEVRSGASLCVDIHSSRLRVLPKYHTPGSGLTIRSLSHHLTLAMPCEVVPKFGIVPSQRRREDRLFNILVIPWPYQVERSQFAEVRDGPGVSNLVQGFGFFTYCHGTSPKWPGSGRDSFVAEFIEFVEDVVQAAVREGGPLDVVMLPECAVSREIADALSTRFSQRHPGIFLVCGYGNGSQPGEFGENRVRLSQFPVHFDQAKHHRWRLDRRQIQQYTLAGYLRPDRTYYEHLKVGEREMCFAVFGDLSVATLICEDLARPDPVGDLIRGVGPNLVLALLMDGPQLRDRWAGRYASVLADDPGSSVLSVTSLGMANLSRPPDGASRSRIIGLWKDSETGSREIVIEPSSHAVVISTTLESREEWTADGRPDTDGGLPTGGKAIYPQFFSALSIKAGNPVWPIP